MSKVAEQTVAPVLKLTLTANQRQLDGKTGLLISPNLLNQVSTHFIHNKGGSKHYSRQKYVILRRNRRCCTLGKDLCPQKYINPCHGISARSSKKVFNILGLCQQLASVPRSAERRITPLNLRILATSLDYKAAIGNRCH